ncbi:MAG: hypothetical protein ACKOXP_01210 [Flavobacteriales bacterium]
MSQLLLNQEGEAFTEQPFFNADVVRSNHIKSIEGNYSTKKPGEVIKETSDWARYKFDELGRLIESLDIHTVKNRKDTTLHQYAYNERNQLTEHRKSEYNGFTTYKYSYDTLHRLMSEETYRDIYSYATHQLVQSYLINTEYFEYVNRPGELEQIRLNNYHLPYLDEVSYYNNDGYLLKKTIHYRMSSIEHHYVYGYNERGLLASKAHFNEQDESAEIEWKYRYDTFGNLIEAHFFRYGDFQKDLQIVFDTKTQLLGSTIQRNVETNFLLILRFTKYTYYK